MVSSSIPSPIAYEPPAPRRETARAKDNLGFAQILEAASADQSEPSQDAKGADASAETVRPPKRSETMRPARDDHKSDAAKPAAQAGKTHANLISDAKTPNDIDNTTTVQRDEPDGISPTPKGTEESDAGANAQRLEDQTANTSGQNSHETEDNSLSVTSALLISPQGSSTAQTILQLQDTETKNSLSLSEAKALLTSPSATTASLVTLNKDKDETAINAHSLEELADSDLNAEPTILDNKSLQPKKLKTDTDSKLNSTVLTMISGDTQKNKFEDVYADLPISALTDHATSNINMRTPQSDSAISLSTMRSNIIDPSRAFVSPHDESQIEPFGVANANLPLDQAVTTQASAFVPAHSSTPLLTGHAAPITASGRIVYPSLPYSSVPMEIGLSALEGQRSIHVRLAPADLGTIDIELDVSDQSEARAHISADDPRTLAMLKQDAPFIRQALEQTGLSTHADSLNFSLRQDGQSGARQNPNEQRASSATSPQNKLSTDQAAPLSTPLPPTPMKRITSLLDLNI